MKKLRAVLSALFMLLVIPAFADEAKFVRDYKVNHGYRLYSYSDYLNGNFRSNFISIPQSRMLDYLDGFGDKVGVFDVEGKTYHTDNHSSKVGVFELDGNTLYVGWCKNGSGNFQMCDADGNFFINQDTYKNHEECFFRYENNTWGGIITEIELKGKKYTVAVAALTPNNAGIRTSDVGFRMWVENEPSKDTALSKKFNGVLNYEYVDIHEGIYKPGWKRLWGTDGRIDETGELIYKYTYKDFEFLGNYNQNAAESLLNLDGSLVKLSNFTEPFRIYMTDKDGNIESGSGVGFEADAQLGNNKVRIAVISCLGKFIFVKDTSGYPVIQTKTTAADKAKKSGKAKKSTKGGKSAQFTRDFNKWARVYSKEDIAKGLYKANYKSIPQKGTTPMTFKDKDSNKYEFNGAKFDLNNEEVLVFYASVFGGVFLQSANIKDNKTVYLNKKNTFKIEGSDINGIEADVMRDGEKLCEVAIVALDPVNGDYRFFVKTAPDEETAMNEKDVFGIEYYNCVDIQSGIYKPGFEKLKMNISNDDSQKALFENVTDDNPVFVVDYQGFKFLVGPAQDPVNYVRNLDGSVIHNPETQIRYMLYNSKGETNCHQGTSYGWEGKVKLGEKEVTLAVFKWNYIVNVFVKE